MNIELHANVYRGNYRSKCCTFETEKKFGNTAVTGSVYALIARVWARKYYGRLTGK